MQYCHHLDVCADLLQYVVVDDDDDDGVMCIENIQTICIYLPIDKKKIIVIPFVKKMAMFL